MHWNNIEVNTTSREELVDVTAKVLELVQASGLEDGICHLYVPHTTAGLTINENADPSVKYDILETLAAIIPRRGNYRHSEGNSDAHIKASLVGHNHFIPIRSGQPALGTWQGVFFCEFDGPRRRHLMVACSTG